MAAERDVVIAGGGPAGAVAARLLAGWGVDVELLTRPAPHRALIESLPPSAGKILDHAGLGPAVEAAGFIRATGNTAWWGRGPARSEPFGGSSLGYQVLRSKFDRVLLDQAALAGARVRRRALVRGVSDPGAGGHRIVQFDSAGKPGTIRAQWVLDATGRAGLTTRTSRAHLARGLRTLALVAAWEHPGGWPVADPSHTLVESGGEGWAWSVPQSATRRYLAVMVDPAVTPLAGRGRLGAAYRDELRRFPNLHGLLAGARMVGRPWARDASPYSTAHPGEPGLLRVGDASSFSDPLSSFGVKKAMASGWLAAVVVRSALEDPGVESAALDLFNRRERAIADALGRRAAEFARAAAGDHAGDYWQRRALADEGDPLTGDPDVATLREDPGVLSAFQELKRRDGIILRPAGHLRLERRPTIRADRVVLEEQLVVPAFPAGIRWLREVDLVQLVALAPAARDVPQLFEACARQNPGARLADFLGALSVLIAKGALEFA